MELNKGWIEFFTGGSNSAHFATAIQTTSDLVVPAISITEVYRWILRESSLSHALTAAAMMKQGKVIPLDEKLAVIAAEISHRYRLPLADGIIYATSRDASANLLTQDSDLEGLQESRISNTQIEKANKPVVRTALCAAGHLKR